MRLGGGVFGLQIHSHQFNDNFLSTINQQKKENNLTPSPRVSLLGLARLNVTRFRYMQNADDPKTSVYYNSCLFPKKVHS